MTISLGPTLPGFASTRAASEQTTTNAKGEDSGFGKMLRGSGKPPRSERQAAAEMPEQQRAKLVPASLARLDSQDEQPALGTKKISAAKSSVPKTARDDADARQDKQHPSTEKPGQSAGSAPLQDHLPLLMALHDLRHFSASAQADAPDIVADEIKGSSLDGPAALSKAFPALSGTGAANKATQTISRSERTTMIAGSFTGEEEQQPVDTGQLASAPKRQESATFRPPMDATATDGPGLQTRHASPMTRSVEAAQSPTPSEAGKQPLSGGRVDVVSEQSFAAPVQNPMSQAATAVVGTIASDAGLRQAVSTPSTASRTAVPAHILKIELHPAELGMVTANLRLAGEQLSIELKPETHEAYRRLASDSEAIVKSLRGLGFEVDKVTILQPSIAVSAAARTDASGAQPPAAGRDQSSFQPGNSNGSNGGAGGQQAGQQPGRSRDDDAQEFGRATSSPREQAGGDMFI